MAEQETTEQEWPHMLPRKTLLGKTYFVDRRLNEVRNVENPHDSMPLDEFEQLSGEKRYALRTLMQSLIATSKGGLQGRQKLVNEAVRVIDQESPSLRFNEMLVEPNYKSNELIVSNAVCRPIKGGDGVVCTPKKRGGKAEVEFT